MLTHLLHYQSEKNYDGLISCGPSLIKWLASRFSEVTLVEFILMWQRSLRNNMHPIGRNQHIRGVPHDNTGSAGAARWNEGFQPAKLTASRPFVPRSVTANVLPPFGSFSPSGTLCLPADVTNSVLRSAPPKQTDVVLRDGIFTWLSNLPKRECKR